MRGRSAAASQQFIPGLNGVVCSSVLCCMQDAPSEVRKVCPQLGLKVHVDEIPTHVSGDN